MPRQGQGSADGAAHVFINCPFDEDYRKLLDAIVFAICALGFEPCCALERDDGSEERLGKILSLIDQCSYGVHDLSRMDLDQRTGLPRFNMPFELGLFLGARRSKMSCLILDRQRWRYRKSLSDLSGRDIRVHGGSPTRAIGAIREWLATESGRTDAPGASYIAQQYRRFRRELPGLCLQTKRRVDELIFSEYRAIAIDWLRTNA